MEVCWRRWRTRRRQYRRKSRSSLICKSQHLNPWDSPFKWCLKVRKAACSSSLPASTLRFTPHGSHREVWMCRPTALLLYGNLSNWSKPLRKSGVLMLQWIFWTLRKRKHWKTRNSSLSQNRSKSYSKTWIIERRPCIIRIKRRKSRSSLMDTRTHQPRRSTKNSSSSKAQSVCSWKEWS